jgi:hypothetical protein
MALLVCSKLFYAGVAPTIDQLSLPDDATA